MEWIALAAAAIVCLLIMSAAHQEHAEWMARTIERLQSKNAKLRAERSEER